MDRHGTGLTPRTGVTFGDGLGEEPVGPARLGPELGPGAL